MANQYDYGEADETAYGEPHPYDAPFAYMMAMRKDIQDLRQALHAEQQQRAQEVLELKQEVTTLREALKKEIAERNTICHRFNLDITKLQSNSGKGVDELKAVHRQQLGQLNQMLQDEIRDRRASEALRDTREASSVNERAGEMTTMAKEINAHKAAFYAFKDEQVNRVNNVVHDIEAIVAQIFKIGYASESLRSVSFMSNNRPDPDAMGGPMTSMRNRSPEEPGELDEPVEPKLELVYMQDDARGFGETTTIKTASRSSLGAGKLMCFTPRAVRKNASGTRSSPC